MVNLLVLMKPLVCLIMKLAGVRPQTVEIEPGTVMNFWAPPPPNDAVKKPSIVFLHGFAADGILTWAIQVLGLGREYAVYVPDLIFFGGSASDRPDRSTDFQAECVASGLRKLGVDKCTVVGLSYGGMVGFKMARLFPDLVEALVVSATVHELTESISRPALEKLGFKHWSQFLLPETVQGVKTLLSIGTHKMPFYFHLILKDFLEVMFSHRKERGELLEALVIPDKNSTLPCYPQRILFLWGDDDKIFDFELANKIKEKLGDGAWVKCLKKAGHLPQLERPIAYNRQLKHFLASLYSKEQKQH